METEGHFEKLEKADEGCFISSIVLTRKKNGAIKLALDSQFLNDQICKNKYQMRPTSTNLMRALLQAQTSVLQP